MLIKYEQKVCPVQQSAPLLYRAWSHPRRARRIHCGGAPLGVESHGGVWCPWGYPKFVPESFLDAGEGMRQSDMTLDDVRALIKEVRAQGLQIQSHYKRLEQEYSDWEDRVNELEKIIYQAELDTGLTKEQIYREPNEFGDELGVIDLDDVDIDEEEGDTTNILDNPP